MNFSFKCTFFGVLFTGCCKITTNAQKAKLAIQISSDRLLANDTLDIVGTFTLSEKKLPPATFAMVMKENNGDGIWQMRWPMIDGHAEASLIFPPGIKKGNYTLYFAVEPRFFQIYGHILYPPGIKKLSGIIYSSLIDPKELEIPIINNEFKIDKFLFPNTAIFELDIPQSKKMPAIAIDAWLDSTFEPAASISKEITIGMGENSIMENKKVDDWLAYFDPFYKINMLKNLTAAQKFDSVYISADFKKNIVKQFDCLSDSELIKSGSLETFLKRYFPGFTMNTAYDENAIPAAAANGYGFVFYLDEKPANFSSLNDIKLSDIALIKIVSPLLTNTRDIIVLYTKQGPFWNQDYYRYKYIINGYQPPIYAMPQTSKMFATSPYYLH